MKLDKIKKYVINLKRRPENLQKVNREFQKLNWEVERFEAIDTNSYQGCLLSHISLIKKAKKLGLKEILVCEDDIIFLPWSKSYLKDLDKVLTKIDYDIINLNPSLHAEYEYSSESNLLLDIKKPKVYKDFMYRGIYSTGMILYTENVYDSILEIDENCIHPLDPYVNARSIDQHLSSIVYPKFKSYTTTYPLCFQRNKWSDINKTEDRAFYLQSYNWNLYTPVKADHMYSDQSYVETINEDLNYKDIYIEK